MMFRLVLLAILLVVLVPADRSEAEVFDPTVFTLPNGLQVVVIENHVAPVATQMVWYKVGAADEPVGVSGIAHFLEHLMFKGTKSLAPGEFSRIVARNGGSENAFTSVDYTAYFQSFSVDRLDLMMKLEADRMANLVLSDEVVLPERDVILEERRQRVDGDPGAKLAEMATAALYLNHPYRVPTIGWEHEMRRLATEDALAFYRTWYAPNNAVLVVAGDVDPAKVRRLAETHFGPIAARPVPQRIRPQEPVQHAPRRVVLESSQVRQATWSRRWLAPSYGSDKGQRPYALQVLAELLGNSTVSRLYRALAVEQKIATDAGTGYSADALDQTAFIVYAAPLPGGDLAQLERAVEAVIRDLVDNGAGEAEVEQAKRQLQDRAALARDSLQTAPRVIGAALTTGRTIEEVEAWPDLIGKVTAAEVNAAARALFRPEYSVTSELKPKPTS